MALIVRIFAKDSNGLSRALGLYNLSLEIVQKRDIQPLRHFVIDASQQ
jgi:hypothetical protein